jgi:hypothetical protein
LEAHLNLKGDWQKRPITELKQALNARQRAARACPLIFESADVTFQPLVDTCDETKLPPEGLGSSISRN